MRVRDRDVRDILRRTICSSGILSLHNIKDNSRSSLFLSWNFLGRTLLCVEKSNYENSALISLFYSANRAEFQKVKRPNGSFRAASLTNACLGDKVALFPFAVIHPHDEEARWKCRRTAVARRDGSVIRRGLA